MAHPLDVPPSALLPRLASALKDRHAVTPPDWAPYVKTGVHKQRAPVETEWWYLRSASVLRKISLRGVTGVGRLAADYGGRQDRGSAPYHTRAGSRSVVREIVQQLEKAGLLQAMKKRGRRLSAEGQKLLDSLSKEVLQELAKTRPELAKYL